MFIKKKTIIPLLILMLLFSLSSCHFMKKETKTTDEKVILALENTYPGHTFTTIRPYGTDYEYYGIYQDEEGIEFHASALRENEEGFSCHDGYLKELLRKEGFFEHTEEIALEHGCVFSAKDGNDEKKLRIMIDSEEASPERVAEIAWEILNTPEEFPKVNLYNWENIEKPKYYSEPYEIGFPYEYQGRYFGDWLTSGRILYSWRGKSVEELMKREDFTKTLEESKAERIENEEEREQLEEEEQEGGV